MDSSRTLVNLILEFCIALIVWRYYREQIYSQHLKYSTFWPRFWTGIVDSVVLWPAGALIALLPYCNRPTAWLLPVYVALALSSIIYSITLHMKYGQTLGKMVCRVKVVDWKTEHPIGFRQALLRDAVPLIMAGLPLAYQSSRVMAGKMTIERLVQPEKFQDFSIVSPDLFFGIPIIWFLVEIVTMLTNDQRRALHDFIAGTVVIRTNAVPKGRLMDTLKEHIVQRGGAPDRP